MYPLLRASRACAVSDTQVDRPPCMILRLLPNTRECSVEMGGSQLCSPEENQRYSTTFPKTLPERTLGMPTVHSSSDFAIAEVIVSWHFCPHVRWAASQHARQQSELGNLVLRLAAFRSYVACTTLGTPTSSAKAGTVYSGTSFDATSRQLRK